MVFAGKLLAFLTLHHPASDVRFPAFAVHVRQNDIIAKQVGTEFTELGDTNNREHCLKFMHIPKTGGSTVELVGLAYAKAERPYSFYLDMVFENISQHENAHARQGQKPRTALEIYNDFHDPTFLYPIYMHTRPEYKWWKEPGGFKCTAHAPPMEGSEARAYYSDGCTNFCVVRDPLQRLLSTWVFDHYTTLPWSKKETCTPSEFHKYVVKVQRFKFAMQYFPLCHLVPQVQMVYGAESLAASKQKFCHRVLRYEHFEEEFDALMKEFGRSDVRLSNAPPKFGSRKDCDLTEDDVLQSTKDVIYDLYRADYDAFDFKRP